MTTDLYAVPIQQMVDNFRHVLEGAMSQFEDPRDAVTAAATAGIIFAGLQAGTLFALGDWPDTPEQRVAQRDDEVREAREEAEHQRRRANGYKGHATKITKRAKAGICPCCNRHFVQLERHMASKHPEFTPLELEGEAA